MVITQNFKYTNQLNGVIASVITTAIIAQRRLMIGWAPFFVRMGVQVSDAVG
jgi:hypothetical protein